MLFHESFSSDYVGRVSANPRLDSLHDLIKHMANVRVTCRTCDKVSVFDAARFARYCHLRCWNQQLEALSGRLKCSRCGAQGGALEGDEGAGRQGSVPA